MVVKRHAARAGMQMMARDGDGLQVYTEWPKHWACSNGRAWDVALLSLLQYRFNFAHTHTPLVMLRSASRAGPDRIDSASRRLRPGGCSWRPAPPAPRSSAPHLVLQLGCAGPWPGSARAGGLGADSMMTRTRPVAARPLAGQARFGESGPTWYVDHIPSGISVPTRKTVHVGKNNHYDSKSDQSARTQPHRQCEGGAGESRRRTEKISTSIFFSASFSL